jgi:hypothetical protein
MDETSQRLRDAIVAYVRSHPRATDTIAGIRWWVPEVATATSDAVMHDVLAWLVEEGVLARTHLPGNVELFSVRGAMKWR